MKKRLFLQNAAILTVTSLLLRTLGIVFRIFISQRIGSEGMGLYQMILSVYVLFASFASGGLTTAVTRLCTDEFACGSEKSARKILYYATTLGIIIGLLSAIGIYIFSEQIAHTAIHDVRAIPSLKILTISLPFMGISSCIKGYFMAKRKVTASSISQILEQLVRIGAILCILEIRDINSVEYSCFAILLGDSIAEGVSCMYMVIAHLIDRQKPSPSHSRRQYINGRICPKLFSIAAPITGGKYLSSGLRTIESLIVPTSLTMFHGSREEALSDFGKLKGMALPLMFFPSSFLMSVSMLLIPELSQSKALGNTNELKRTVEYTVRITLLSSLLIGGIFWILADDIGQLVYNDRSIGTILRILAPLTPIMYLESVVVGILKGLNQQTHSLIYSVIDSLIRLITIPLLVPSFGMNGFYIIMIVSNLLTCSLNMYRLRRVTNICISVSSWIVRPSIALIISILSVMLLYTSGWSLSHDSVMHCLLHGGILCIEYGILLLVFGCVTSEDRRILNRA